VKKKTYHPQTGRHETVATCREQALCLAALESGEYDGMTDKEWVLLCEEVAKKTADLSRMKDRPHIGSARGRNSDVSF